MYAAIVVDEYGKVPKHANQGREIDIYNSDTGIIEKRISLDGIDKATFPGWRVAREASDNNVDQLYAGKELKILRIPVLSRLLGFRKMENKARPGSSISDIVRELPGKYKPKELAPAYPRAA